MREESVPITFTVTERYVNLHFEGASICCIAIDNNGRPVFAFPNTMMRPAVRTIEGSLIKKDCRLLDVTMVYQETEPDMALPRFQRAAIRAPTTPSKIRVRVREGGKMAKQDVEDIVARVVQSFIDEPQQSKKRTAEITRTIAAQTGIPVMSIAGVRAALSKDMYGDFEEMKRSAKYTAQREKSAETS